MTMVVVVYKIPLQVQQSVKYNNAHSSIRGLIERCNGVLKNRLRCLLKEEHELSMLVLFCTICALLITYL